MEGPAVGTIVVICAGVLNGSFPAPSKRIRGWSWEHGWLVYSLVAMVILPITLSVVSGARLPRIIGSGSSALVLGRVVGFGFLFGLGSVLFGLSLVRLGMAVTNALISGVVAALGSMGPVLLGVDTIDQRQALWLICGQIILMGGLGVCAWAVICRDRVTSRQDMTRESDLRTILGGLLIALLAGCLSSMLNYGFADSVRLVSGGGKPSATELPIIWALVLAGGALPNVGYSVYLITRAHSWAVMGYEHIWNWALGILMGALWFFALFLYGLGAPLMGNTGEIYGWVLIVGTSILTSNAWGAKTGEWRRAPARAKGLFTASTVLLIGAIVILAVES